jgi:hypothetical protein
MFTDLSRCLQNVSCIGHDSARCCCKMLLRFRGTVHLGCVRVLQCPAVVSHNRCFQACESTVAACMLDWPSAVLYRNTSPYLASTTSFQLWVGAKRMALNSGLSETGTMQMYCKAKHAHQHIRAGQHWSAWPFTPSAGNSRVPCCTAWKNPEI